MTCLFRAFGLSAMFSAASLVTVILALFLFKKYENTEVYLKFPN